MLYLKEKIYMFLVKALNQKEMMFVIKGML